MPAFPAKNALPSVLPKANRHAVMPVTTTDGAYFELLCVQPGRSWSQLVYWLPAMGVPARHYLPLAEALAARGIAVVIHEWRGIGSSDQRAGRHSNWGYRELLMDDVPAAMAVVRAHWPEKSLYLGGHSLGGQIASLYAALHPTRYAGMVLVASGAPYWRCYRQHVLIALGCMLAPVVAGVVGYLPGRRIGFAGNEARRLTSDWARTARTGRYSKDDVAPDMDGRLASLQLPVLALRMRDDWLAPAGSLAWLLGKMPLSPQTVTMLAPENMAGQAADHFSWMQAPTPIAERIAAWMSARGAGS
jgi:predicted alpha/beta hydrolase